MEKKCFVIVAPVNLKMPFDTVSKITRNEG